MKVDTSLHSSVALCEECHWRDIFPTAARAWTALAQHAKFVHGDYRAVARARDAAYQSKKRAHIRAVTRTPPKTSTPPQTMGA